MSKMALLAGMLGAVFAAPVLGVWEYQGTEVYVSEPTWMEDPYGTWYCGWDGSGDAYGEPGYLATWGWTGGAAGVELAADMGTSRYAYAESRINASSSYDWVADNTSKDITLYVYVTINDASVDYMGYADSDEETCSASSSCSVFAEGGDGGSGGAGGYYPFGVGQGSGSSGGTADAANTPYDVDPDENSTYEGWGPGFGEYAGWLTFACEAYNELEYHGTTEDNTFTVYSSVNGMAYAQGQCTIYAPEPWGGFWGDASYYVSGTSQVYLSGSIE